MNFNLPFVRTCGSIDFFFLDLFFKRKDMLYDNFQQSIRMQSSSHFRPLTITALLLIPVISYNKFVSIDDCLKMLAKALCSLFSLP